MNEKVTSKTSSATSATVILNCIIGSITKKEKNGKIQIYMRVATHRKIKGVEKADWHNVVVYGNLAKVVDTYIEVGNKILFEGEMEVWEFKDKETKKISKKNYIRVNSLDFKTGAKINLIGFCGGKYRKNDESPLYIDIKTTRKVLKGNDKINQEDFHKVVLYGKLADTIEQADIEGKKIFIVGSLETLEVENNDDGKKYNDEQTFIRARRIKFL